MAIAQFLLFQATVLVMPAPLAGERFDLRADVATPLAVMPRCGDARAGEIVVCGPAKDRYRLPLPREHERAATERAPGEAAAPVAALVPQGRCGMFTGERRCGKAEAARYGYGGGRDPVTLLTRLGTRLIDPDAELAPLPTVP